MEKAHWKDIKHREFVSFESYWVVFQMRKKLQVPVEERGKS